MQNMESNGMLVDLRLMLDQRPPLIHRLEQLSRSVDEVRIVVCARQAVLPGDGSFSCKCTAWMG